MFLSGCQECGSRERGGSRFEDCEVTDLQLSGPRRGHLVDAAQDECGPWLYDCEFACANGTHNGTHNGVQRSSADLLTLRDVLPRDVPGAVVPPLSERAVTNGDERAVALFANRLRNSQVLRTSRALCAFCLDVNAFRDMAAELDASDSLLLGDYSLFSSPLRTDERSAENDDEDHLKAVAEWRQAEETELTTLRASVEQVARATRLLSSAALSDDDDDS